MTAPHRTRLERRGGFLIFGDGAIRIEDVRAVVACENAVELGYAHGGTEMLAGWTLAEVLDVIEGKPAEGAPLCLDESEVIYMEIAADTLRRCNAVYTAERLEEIAGRARAALKGATR